MSATPRTDELWAKLRFDSHMQCVSACNLLVRHARDTECDLTAAKAKLAMAEKLIHEYVAHAAGCHCAQIPRWRESEYPAFQCGCGLTTALQSLRE